MNLPDKKTWKEGQTLVRRDEMRINGRWHLIPLQVPTLLAALTPSFFKAQCMDIVRDVKALIRLQ